MRPQHSNQAKDNAGHAADGYGRPQLLDSFLYISHN